MSEHQTIGELLLAPFNPPLAALLLLSAGYLLTFCINDAKAKNHPRAEKAARIGGWLYAAVGAAALVKNLF